MRFMFVLWMVSIVPGSSQLDVVGNVIAFFSLAEGMTCLMARAYLLKLIDLNID